MSVGVCCCWICLWVSEGVFEWYLQMSELLWGVGVVDYLMIQFMQAQVRLQPSSNHFGKTPKGKIICDLAFFRQLDIKTSYGSFSKMMELCCFVSFLGLSGKIYL